MNENNTYQKKHSEIVISSNQKKCVHKVKVK